MIIRCLDRKDNVVQDDLHPQNGSTHKQLRTEVYVYLVASQNKGTQIWTPKYHSPYLCFKVVVVSQNKGTSI